MMRRIYVSIFDLFALYSNQCCIYKLVVSFLYKCGTEEAEASGQFIHPFYSLMKLIHTAFSNLLFSSLRNVGLKKPIH